MKPVPPVESSIVFSAESLIEGMSQLSEMQELHAKTRAVHAAGFWTNGGDLIVREDVGRHNALDKLIGAAAAANFSGPDGAVLLTSRVSVELIQKTARLGASLIAGISAPTALAIRVAEAAKITLVAVLRGNGFETFTRPEGIKSKVQDEIVR
jgi:FdhD protein